MTEGKVNRCEVEGRRTPQSLKVSTLVTLISSRFASPQEKQPFTKCEEESRPLSQQQREDFIQSLRSLSYDRSTTRSPQIAI